MTTPEGPGALNPDAQFGITGDDGSVPGQELMVQSHVEDLLKAQYVRDNPTLADVLAAIFGDFRPDISLALSIIEAITKKAFGLSGPFLSVSDALANFAEVTPASVMQALKDRLTNIVDATDTDIDNWLLSLATASSVQQFKDALVGLANSTPTDLDNWVLSLLNIDSDLNAAKLTNMSGMSGSDNIPGLATALANIANKLFGTTGLSGQSDASDALEATASAIAQVNASVALLVAQNNNTGVGGKSYIVDFSTRSNSSSMGSDFTQTYSGAGNYPLGIVSGLCQYGSGSGGDRTCRAVYNVGATDYDNQIVGVGLSSQVGSGAKNFLFCRSNSAGTTYVYLTVEHSQFVLGCVVSGVNTVFDTWSSGVSKGAETYWVHCGTAGGAYIYVVYRGSTAIRTYTDSAHVSQVGASFRYAGYGAYITSGGVKPAGGAIWALSDNIIPATNGSFARVYRAATGDTGTSGTGDTTLPSSTFDTVQRITDDITFTASSNRLTVSRSMPYVVHYVLRTDTTTLQDIQPLLYVNGSLYARVRQSETGDGMGSTPLYLEGTFLAYLVAGDYVEPGISLGGIVGIDFEGNASGTSCYMEMIGIPTKGFPA